MEAAAIQTPYGGQIEPSVPIISKNSEKDEIEEPVRSTPRPIHGWKVCLIAEIRHN
jgi:hypothetical protein